MDSKTPRVFILDLDGTLAESKSPMRADMGEALAELLQKVPVGIMSGGSFEQFKKQFLPFFPSNTVFENLYLFPTSASACYTFEEGEWRAHYTNTFSGEERSRVIAALKEALIESSFETPEKVWGPQIEDRGSQITFSALGQEAPYEQKKKFDADRKKRMPLQAALLKRLPEFSIRVNATTTIDITKEGLNKAYGVQRFSEMLQVPIADMLYIGDALFEGGNDEIVKETGVPVKEVKDPQETLAFIKENIALL